MSSPAATAAPATRSQLAAAFRAVAVVAVLLISGLFVFGLPAASAAPASVGSAIHAPTTLAKSIATPATVTPTVTPNGHAPSGSSLRLAPRPALAPSSGRGTFLESSNLSHPSVNNLWCGKPYYFASRLACPNTTFDPSINVTTNGIVGVAYTAYTNHSACTGLSPSIQNNTSTSVAFQASTNGGVTWGNAVYLGNTNCSAAANFTNAWSPTLTSLANGTLVVAYVLMSFGQCSYFYCSHPFIPNVFGYEVPYDQLVVQESYNNGSTWSNATVVNSTYDSSAVSANCATLGYQAFQPSISARGNDIFLAWTNQSDADGCSFSAPYSAEVHLVSSTNGGATWSNQTTFPTTKGVSYGSQSTYYASNPYVLAASNGQVYVAYGTALNMNQVVCQNGNCITYAETENVMIANSSTGTANWTVNTVARGVPFDYSYGITPNWYDTFLGVAPQLGYNGLNHQLYTVYTTEEIGYFCYMGMYCYLGYETAVGFQNSSNGGVNWSKPETIGNLVNPNYGPENYEAYPTITVDHNGTAQVAFSVYNESICVGVYCGAFVEMYANTTDNGTSWNGPFVVSPYVAPGAYGYRGEYNTAAVMPSGRTLFAWVNSVCPPSATYCDFMSYYGPEVNSTVTVSWLYAGTGATLSFTETNLTGGALWSAELMGNTRQGTAGTTLSVSGVPPTEPVFWSVPWVNLTYGQTWESTPGASNPVPPHAFASSATLTYSFAEYVELLITVNPPIDSFYLNPLYHEATYSMSPLPGVSWVPVNSTQTLVVAPQSISCTTGCFYYNLTWVSWTGMGPGSASSNNTTITAHIGTSPVNETANFLFNGYCDGYSAYLYCYPTYGYPLTFHEKGLPSGTTWAVTVVNNSGPNGTVVNVSSGAWVNASTGQNAVQYTVWTVPSGTGGYVWVPTSNPASPVKEPTQTLVNVTYTRMNATQALFQANFTATGLPNGTVWSADVGTASYAVTAGNLSVTVPGGTSLALNGSPVYTENGVGYYVSSVSVRPFVVNNTWANTTTLPDAYTFLGSAHIYVQYSPMFWLQVSATSGGTVGPASRWVQTGATVNLTATANPGYHFLDWASVGAGGTTAAQSHNATATIHPSAPVSELATFRRNPPPTWNVTVTSNGLPTGVGFTFALGNVTYTSSGGTATVGELLNGSYGFAAETAYSAASMGTRWVPTSWYASYGAPVSGGLAIRSDGTITVNFTTQYLLTVASTPDGTVTPTTLLGATWEVAGTVVTLTATPSFHYKFAGWNASGTGSMAGTTPMITVHLSGPVWESASFEWRIFPPPAVFTLTVTESGLPTGVGWNISAGAGNGSASGASANLVLTGLNGSYTLVVPPVYVGIGTRYVANTTGATMVASNATKTVTFDKQFALTVNAGAGGSVSASGTSWVSPSTSETLVATPAPGYQFVSWNGTAPGSATATTTLSVNGPTNETATFAPIVKPAVQPAANAGQSSALAILAVLLVVGLVVGLVAGRRRAGRPPSEPEASEPMAEPEPEGSEYTMPPPSDEGVPPGAGTAYEETPSDADYNEGPG